MIGKISLGTEKYPFSYNKNSQHISYKRDFFNLIKKIFAKYPLANAIRNYKTLSGFLLGARAKLVWCVHPSHHFHSYTLSPPHHFHL